VRAPCSELHMLHGNSPHGTSSLRYRSLITCVETATDQRRWGIYITEQTFDDLATGRFFKELAL
jgi:hypothetical protein